MKSSAVFFDIDGTLVDTTYLHAIAWWRAFRDHGEQVDFWRCHRAIGMGSDQLIERLIGRDAPEISDGHGTHFQSMHPEVVAFPFAAELLHRAARGARVVLVTSAKERDLEVLLEAIDAEDAIDSVVTSADVEASKPAPDLFEVALERASVDRGRCLAVGDTIWDVEASGRSGISCIGLLTGGNSEAELTRGGMIEVHRDPRALLEAPASVLWSLVEG